MAEERRFAVSRADLAACFRLLRRGSKSFAAASLLLPRRVRRPVAGMYAFCRVADDAVDESADRAAGLDRLRERLERVYASRPEDHPVDRTFAAVVEVFEIPRAVPEALLEGFAWDVEGRRYETISEVRGYSARVASTVGVMMSLLMGRRDAKALARAADLGVAMQLTNIARDVGEDARAGRIYLPLTELRGTGIDPDEWLASPSFSPELGQVVEGVLSEADRLYVRADVGIGMLPRDCRGAIRAARLIYADIGRMVRRAGLDSVSRRAHTSRWRKVMLLARALLSGTPIVAGGDEPPLEETRYLVASTGG